MSENIIKWDNDNTENWTPTTLDQVGKDEWFLETILSDNPQLLRLENRLSGIREPYVAFRQLSFNTPQGRSIRPDIVYLTGSGHVIITETKLYKNPELKDRRVIAQVVDYAASFSALSEQEITNLFSNGHNDKLSWSELIQQYFPSEPNCEELAETLISRFFSGNLNLVIACDKAPIGLDELVRGVANQSALEFDLSVVEVTPYTKNGSKPSDIIFIPKTRVATEVISRTVVTVGYRQNDQKPSVDVKTTSIEEIEKGLVDIKEGRRPKYWDEKSVLESVGTDADITKRLIEWFYSKGVKANFPKTLNPTIRFMVNQNGSAHKICDINGAMDKGELWLSFIEYSNLSPFDSDEKRQELVDKINSIGGIDIPADSADNTRRILISALKDELAFTEFTKVYDWFLDQIIE